MTPIEKIAKLQTINMILQIIIIVILIMRTIMGI